MAKKERNRGSVDRARAKRGSGQANQEPEMRFMDVPAGMPAGEPAPTRPTPRPARGSNLAPTSTRDKPVPRPAGFAERADLRKAMDSSDAAFRASKREAADREMGMKAGGKVKKMKAGGEAQDRAAAKADRLRRELESRDSRPARQEAEYQEAQQRRREAGGLSRLAMIPEAVRRAQVRAGDRMLRGAEARETAPKRREMEAADREVTDTLGRKAGGKVKKMAMGGKCRGMGAATRGGNFSRG